MPAATGMPRSDATPVGARPRPTRCDFGARTTGATVAAVQDEDVAIRDAIGWALVADPVLALEICDDAVAVLVRHHAGVRRVGAAARRRSTPPGTTIPQRRASALAWAVVFATMVQDVETADRFAEEALAFERELGDPARLGRICFAIAPSPRATAATVTPRDWADEARR